MPGCVPSFLGSCGGDSTGDGGMTMGGFTFDTYGTFADLPSTASVDDIARVRNPTGRLITFNYRADGFYVYTGTRWKRTTTLTLNYTTMRTSDDYRYYQVGNPNDWAIFVVDKYDTVTGVIRTADTNLNADEAWAQRETITYNDP